MHPYEALNARLAAFVADREWAQFHTPRNLAACLSVEVAELLELYLWTRDGEGPHPPGAEPPPRAALEAEIGDVFLCLLNLCRTTGVDLLAAADRKLDDVGRKYPVELARGSAQKQPGRGPRENLGAGGDVAAPSLAKDDGGA